MDSIGFDPYIEGIRDKYNGKCFCPNCEKYCAEYHDRFDMLNCPSCGTEWTKSDYEEEMKINLLTTSRSPLKTYTKDKGEYRLIVEEFEFGWRVEEVKRKTHHFFFKTWETTKVVYRNQLLKSAYIENPFFYDDDDADDHDIELKTKDDVFLAFGYMSFFQYKKHMYKDDE